MTDWTALCEHIRQRHPTVRLEPHWLGVELAVEGSGVRVKLERVTAFEEPWLLVLAAIGSDRHVDATAALRYNALTAVGALVIENERCYLRAALPLAEATLAALDRTIDFIAREAARLRHVFAPRADVAIALGMFED